MIKKGSVVQANENSGEWCGCLLIVDEVKDWGVQAGMKVPFKGVAYIRLTFDQIEYIGEAILVSGEDE